MVGKAVWASMTMPVVDAKTKMQAEVVIATKSGFRVIPQARQVYNSPLVWLFPENKDDIVIIDWKGLFEGIVSDLKKAAAHANDNPELFESVNIRNQTRLLVLEALRKGVEFNGKKYYPLGWGSGAKDFQTMGMTIELLGKFGLAKYAEPNAPVTEPITRMVRYVEDLARMSRALIPNGYYGGGPVKLRIKFVKDGTETDAGHVAYDGASVLCDDVFDALRDRKRGPIVLGDTPGNYGEFQMFPWEVMREEYEKAQAQFFDDVKNSPIRMTKLYAKLSDYKRELLGIEPMMINHPLFAAPVTRSQAEALYTQSTTMYVRDTKYRLVLPARYGFYVIPGKGRKFIIVRWPVDAPSNVQAVEVDPDSPLFKEETERLFGMRAAQFTMTNLEFSAKGVFQVVKRESPDWDLMMSIEDVKMVSSAPVYEWRKVMKDTIVEVETFVSLTQYYNASSIILAPPELWKRCGGDYDGDSAEVKPFDQFPRMWDAAFEWSEGFASAKIPKTKTPEFELWADFLYRAWGTQVGFPVNVMAQCYLGQEDVRDDFVRFLLIKIPGVFNDVPEEILAPGEEPRWFHLMWVINRLIKFGTDKFKTLYGDPDEVDKLLSQIQSQGSEYFGGGAPWATWRNNDYAFRMEAPDMITNRKPEEIERAEMDKDFRDEKRWRMHIDDRMADATVCHMYMHMRGWIQEQILRLKSHKTVEMAEALRTLPLSDFVNWAPAVNDVDLLVGKGLVDDYLGLVTKTQMMTARHSVAMNESFAALVAQKAQEMGWSMEYMAMVMWRASHHSRSTMAGASAVFVGCPLEAKEIVRCKPGLKDARVGSFAGDIESFAHNCGISVEALRRSNPDVEFEPGMVVSIPSTALKCIVVGVDYNFEGAGDEVGPFRGAVVLNDTGTETRVMIVTHDVLRRHRGSKYGANVVGLVGRHDFAHELVGLASPPPGQYNIVLNRVINNDGAKTRVWHAHLTKI